MTARDVFPVAQRVFPAAQGVIMVARGVFAIGGQFFAGVPKLYGGEAEGNASMRQVDIGKFPGSPLPLLSFEWAGEASGAYAARFIY